MSPGARRLEGRVSGVRGHLRRRAALAAALWAASAAALFFLAAWIAAGADGWSPGSNVPALVDVAVLACLVGAAIVFRRASERRFGEVPLASTIERSAGLRAGIVRGALELGRSVPGGVSGSLAQRAVEETASALDGREERELSGELGVTVRSWTRRGMGLAVALGVTLTVLAVARPDRTARVWAGVASPIATALDPVLPPLAVSPGDVEIQRGTDVTVTVAAAGRERVTLAWQAAGEVARRQALDVVDGLATHTFSSVGATIEYRVLDDVGSESPSYRIVPVDPLFVSDLVVGVVYPPHTGIAPDEYRGETPPLRLPVGSTVTFEGLASRPLASAALVDSSGAEVLPFLVEGTGFRADWRPRAGGVFEWAFADESGGGAEIQPQPLSITVVPDSVPVVAIPVPGRDTILPVDLRLPLVLSAQDDYGLRRMELVAYRVTAFGARQEPVVQGLDLGGTRAAFARPLLDLRTWGLLPGDTVRYFARAVDNAPGGQVGASPEYVLRMPAAAELQREAEATLEGAAERLEELAEEAARLAEENRDQALEAAARQQEGDQRQADADFEEREDLQGALEEQLELSGQVDSLRNELRSLEELLEEAGQADPELRRQLEELQELLERMTGEELRERMDDLAEALEQDDMQRATESLEDLAAEQDRLRERLEESLEQFKRAAVEQDFRATTGEAEELARQEQALADAMREEDQPELRAEQQEQLMDRAEQLDGSMERLEERLRELGEEQAADGVEQARERSAESRERMEEARQQADRGANREAGERAEEAAEQMSQAADALQEAQQQMAQQQAQAQQEAFRRTADDALALARRQNELRERMGDAGREELAEMRAEQASIMRGLQNMAENLAAEAEDAGGAQQEVSAQIGRTMEAVEETLQAMASQRAQTQAEDAIGSLNQLALTAMAVASQMGQQGQGQGGEEIGEQLQQLAQQQGDLMNQSNQLMPMQLGEQAMSQQMQQLSEGQNSVAGDLGDLASEPGSEEALGDLRQLAQEAELLARELAQGRLTPEVLERQERLFHRLLDAGRSLEREERSEERESEVPGAFERGDVMPLLPEALGAMPYALPDGERLRALPPSVRQLVLQYFERLNGGRGGGGS